jgi:hypothetical protein
MHYILYDKFSKMNMVEDFVNKFYLNITYSLLIKFSFAGNKLFYMARK